MKHLALFGAACLVALAFSAPQAEATTTIDHFTDGFFQLVVDDGTASDSDSQTGLAVLGGRRDVLLTRDVAGGGVQEGSANNVDVSPSHYLNYSNDAGVESTLLLEYPILANSGSTYDMEGDGCLSLLIEFLISDLGSHITFTVEDGDSDSDSVTKPAVAGPNVFVFDFTEFAAAVDFDDVAYVALEIDGVSEGDYRIDAIECGVIPEPITMLGLVFGLGGVGAYIRKRRMV
jgi:hypothetical protein